MNKSFYLLFKKFLLPLNLIDLFTVLAPHLLSPLLDNQEPTRTMIVHSNLLHLVFGILLLRVTAE